MKKSELRQIIREEIQRLTEIVDVKKIESVLKKHERKIVASIKDEMEYEAALGTYSFGYGKDEILEHFIDDAYTYLHAAGLAPKKKGTPEWKEVNTIIKDWALKAARANFKKYFK